MRGFRKRWATASNEEPAHVVGDEYKSVSPSIEVQDDADERTSSSWVDVSLAIEPRGEHRESFASPVTAMSPLLQAEMQMDRLTST